MEESAFGKIIQATETTRLSRRTPQAGENLTSPTLVEDGYNGKPVVRFNGTSDGMQFPFDNLDQTAEATGVRAASFQQIRPFRYDGRRTISRCFISMSTALAGASFLS